jgi:acetyltransferase-like isoleucine patch superfamily enzyme
LKLGSASYVHPTVQIIGLSDVVIGRQSCIGAFTWINVNHRGRATGPAIQIGSNSFIGRDNFFSSGREIIFGDYCLTAKGCNFICSSHKIDNPAKPYISTGTTDDESIRIGTNCFFGVNATVLGNVAIGYGSVIGANAFVTKDVPPFSIVLGNPARVVKRYSFSSCKWIDIDCLEEDDLREMPSEENYKGILADTSAEISIPWIAAGPDLGNL